jgi:hypothetical protein
MIRLLKRSPTGDFELISFHDGDAPWYAILSHTWANGEEVTYGELVAGTSREKTGFARIRFCSERAAADGFQYFWVDTCCINKSAPKELQTASQGKNEEAESIHRQTLARQEKVLGLDHPET